MSKIKRPRQSRKARLQALPDEEESSSDTRRLIFFYDCEATGFSVYNDHITEIAAKVIVADELRSQVSHASFSKLVHTTRYIPERVSDLTGITRDLLRDEKPFSVIFPKFLDWISTTTKEVSEASKAPHTPVLVAHNGYQYDFPILLAEIERSCEPELHVSMRLITQKISFADSLHHLRQAKRNGHPLLSSIPSLKLKTLSEHFEKPYSAHRALPDAEVMEELFTKTELADLLPSIPTRSAEEQLKHWQDQKAKKRAKKRATAVDT